MTKYKKSAIAVVLTTVFLMLFFHKPVLAAKKKLTVQSIYTTTKKVKGTTVKNFTVKIKIGKKTYQKKADKKGTFSIRIPKQKVGTSFYVKVYKGKKLYTKKKVYVMTKGLSLHAFSRTSRTIKGYTRPGYTVKAAISNQSYLVYSTKANSKGMFKITLKENVGDRPVEFYLYNTKKKCIKTLYKKASNAKKAPSKEAAIDQAQLTADLSAKKIIDRSMIGTCANDPDNYYYFIHPNGKRMIGYVGYYMDDETYSSFPENYTIKALNGITLYYTYSGGSLASLREPSLDDYDGIISSESKKQFHLNDKNIFPNGKIAMKVIGYKNGKLVMMNYQTIDPEE